jgi:hypothetical protein
LAIEVDQKCSNIRVKSERSIHGADDFTGLLAGSHSGTSSMIHCVEVDFRTPFSLVGGQPQTIMVAAGCLGPVLPRKDARTWRSPGGRADVPQFGSQESGELVEHE